MSNELADEIVKLHAALARPVEVAHQHIDLVLVNGSERGTIFHQVQLEVEAVEEAFPAQVQLEVHPLDVEAVVPHELASGFVDLSQLLEEGLPSERELGEGTGAEDVFQVLDLLHLFIFLGALEEGFRQLEAHRQEGMDEIFKADALRALVGRKFTTEKTAAYRVTRYHLPWKLEQASVQLQVADVSPLASLSGLGNRRASRQAWFQSI